MGKPWYGYYQFVFLSKYIITFDKLRQSLDAKIIIMHIGLHVFVFNPDLQKVPNTYTTNWEYKSLYILIVYLDTFNRYVGISTNPK